MKTSDYTPVPAGNHVARVYSIIHIGTTHDSTPWGEKDRNKVRITLELPNERKEFKPGEGEKPFSISATYTLNFGEKANLRKIVEGMVGASLFDEEAATFDVETLLGKACMVNVTHKTKDGKTYANVDAVTPVPKGMTAPEPENEWFVLNYTDKWDQGKFDKLPDFLKAQMYETQEYKTKFGNASLTQDDVPF